jgi:hypothetical protein
MTIPRIGGLKVIEKGMGIVRRPKAPEIIKPIGEDTEAFQKNGIATIERGDGGAFRKTKSNTRREESGTDHGLQESSKAGSHDIGPSRRKESGPSHLSQRNFTVLAEALVQSPN